MLEGQWEAKTRVRMKSPQVDNPYRTRLETLKTQLVDEVKELKKCLKAASQD